MADHAGIITGSNATLATAVSTVNTSLSVLIGAVAPQPMQVINCDVSVIPGPVFNITVQTKYQG